MGNSIFRDANFNKAFSDIPVLNFSVGGEMSINMIQRIDAVKDINPQKLFLMTGINDTRCYDVKTIIQHFDRLTDSLSFIPSLYVMSILPIHPCAFNDYASNEVIRNLNSEFSTICASKNITFINVFDKYCINGELPLKYTIDGVHIKAEAYQPIYDAISQYVY